MLWITAAWGACFVAIEWGLRDAPLLWFAALRAVVAGAALLALGGLQHRLAPSGPRAWGIIAVLGLVNVTVAFAAMFAGVAGGAAGTAAVLANAQPLLILLPAWWMFGEQLSLRTAAALVLGFAGLVLVALPAGGGSGAALSLLAAVAVTAGTLLSRRLAGLDLVTATAWHLLIGGAGLVLLAAAVEGAPVISWTPRFIVMLLFLALVGTAATTVAWFAEARHSRLDTLATWTFLTPVFGIALAALALGERPDGLTALGLTAVLMAMWAALHAPPPTPAPAVRVPGPDSLGGDPHHDPAHPRPPSRSCPGPFGSPPSPARSPR
ncbi:DMT family transporter [Ornithinimicrobium sufpigmenti]|uniref:DMT family transporter n=1 Tax=Ornithinimicrobium sufpigmenti TaxID=2508882 RepID=UPI001035CE1C|nr:MULTISPECIES: DMT family transporter [unclassified Ornithinimicrobium]